MVEADVQALSNTIWGFSKLEVVHERLLDAVAAMALRKLPHFNGQNIANTVSISHQHTAVKYMQHYSYLHYYSYKLVAPLLPVEPTVHMHAS